MVPPLHLTSERDQLMIYFKLIVVGRRTGVAKILDGFIRARFIGMPHPGPLYLWNRFRRSLGRRGLQNPILDCVIDHLLKPGMTHDRLCLEQADKLIAAYS